MASKGALEISRHEAPRNRVIGEPNRLTARSMPPREEVPVDPPEVARLRERQRRTEIRIRRPGRTLRLTPGYSPRPGIVYTPDQLHFPDRGFIFAGRNLKEELRSPIRPFHLTRLGLVSLSYDRAKAPPKNYKRFFPIPWPLNNFAPTSGREINPEKVRPAADPFNRSFPREALKLILRLFARAFERIIKAAEKGREDRALAAKRREEEFWIELLSFLGLLKFVR